MRKAAIDNKIMSTTELYSSQFPDYPFQSRTRATEIADLNMFKPAQNLRCSMKSKNSFAERFRLTCSFNSAKINFCVRCTLTTRKIVGDKTVLVFILHQDLSLWQSVNNYLFYTFYVNKVGKNKFYKILS